LIEFARTIAAGRYKQMTASQKNGDVSVAIMWTGLPREPDTWNLTIVRNKIRDRSARRSSMIFWIAFTPV